MTLLVASGRAEAAQDVVSNETSLLIHSTSVILIAEGATTVQSEFFYQANPSQNVVTPEYIHNDTSFQQTGGSKYTGSSQFINFAHQLDLSLLTLDQLVDEIEYRGWKVQISRKTEE